MWLNHNTILFLNQRRLSPCYLSDSCSKQYSPAWLSDARKEIHALSKANTLVTRLGRRSGGDDDDEHKYECCVTT